MSAGLVESLELTSKRRLHIGYNTVTQRLGGRITARGALGAGMRFDIHVPAPAPRAKKAD
jgi:hypothetical protein